MSAGDSNSVSTAALRCSILSARAAGLPVDALLAPVGLDASAFAARARSVEIPLPRVVSILERLLDAGEPGWALRGATRIEPGAMGVLDHLCAAAPTIGASLAELVRYFALVAHGAEVSLQPRGGGLWLELAFPHAPEPMAITFVESALGLTWSRLRAHCGLDDLSAERLELRGRAGHSPPSEWERALGVTPVVGMPRNLLVVSGEVARRALPGHDPALRAFLSDLAGSGLTEEQVREPARTPWTDRVVASLRGARPGAELRHVARTLAVSERTLRRRLAEERTSFSELRQQELRRHAQALLSDERLSPAEVAFSLGFSEMSAFHRAFKRWTGHTPREWRELG